MFTMLVRPLLLVGVTLGVSIGSIACVGSPEAVSGEEGLFDASPPGPPETDAGTVMAASCAPDGGSTWSDLYRDCFGPDHASCGSVGCHGFTTDQGFASSGFVCGTTQDSCWMGITAMNSIVPSGGTSDPTMTSLYENIRKAPPNVGGTMPKFSTFAFTQADLQRISTWIENGAKND